MSNIFESLLHLFGCIWEYYEEDETWSVGTKHIFIVQSKRRKCIRCGKIQRCNNWRRFIGLDTWVGISHE